MGLPIPEELMRRICWLSALLLLPATALGADALDLAKWAPKDSYLVLTWQGADEAASGFAKTHLGELWAEPQIAGFVQTPLAGLFELLKSNIGQDADAQEIFALVQHLLGLMWHRPGVICAFTIEAPGKPSKEWPVNDSLAVIWDLGPETAGLLQKLQDSAQKGTKLQWEPIGDGRFLHPSDSPLYLGRQGDRLLITLGRGAAERIAARSMPPPVSPTRRPTSAPPDSSRGSPTPCI